MSKKTFYMFAAILLFTSLLSFMLGTREQKTLFGWATYVDSELTYHIISAPMVQREQVCSSYVDTFETSVKVVCQGAYR